LGQGAIFTQLAWAKEQFITQLGLDPYPGTLNLKLTPPAEQATWAALKTRSDVLIIPPESTWCQARAYPVRVAGRFPGAIIYPEVPGYPETQLEIIAALPLRQTLALNDGQVLSLEIGQPLSVRAVIFDVDGTLVDTVEAYYRVATLAAKPQTLPISREIVRFALNNNHPTFWELVTPQDHPQRAEVMAAMRQEAMRQWPDVLREHGRLVPGLPETLATLQQRGLRLGIVTGSHGGSFQPLKDRGLLDLFEVVITGADVSQPKPHPEGLLKCLAQLQVAPYEAVYVGDTPVDVQTGRAAGSATVSVLSGAGDSGLLSAAEPDWLIHSHLRLPAIIAKE
jgi:HAD superfamily hydrolase (TIGR01509 family)